MSHSECAYHSGCALAVLRTTGALNHDHLSTVEGQIRYFKRARLVRQLQCAGALSTL